APGAPRGLRRRDPLLPRRVAGAPRGARRLRHRAPATAGAGSRLRGATLEADDLPPRARGAAARVEVHMKAAVMRAIGEPLRIEEIRIDTPGPREVLVRTAAVG